MRSVMRDFLLSFCPAGFRRAFPPESPRRTLRAATWGGLGQFVLAASTLIARLKAHFVRRAHELALHMAGSSEVVQAGTTIIVTLEYLLHPLSILLLYLAIEGLLRFIAGLTGGEVVPNFLVFATFKGTKVIRQFVEQKQTGNALPDSVEYLPDGRIRISSARARPRWNSTITIGLAGVWFEVERVEPGVSPRSYVYCLRPAPVEKVLRGYEEYDLAAASQVDKASEREPQQEDTSSPKNQLT